jgi:hypothetical protein
MRLARLTPACYSCRWLGAMSAMPNLTVDADTARAASVFVERVAAQFPVSGAILFGSRARAVIARTATRTSRCCCAVVGASSSIRSWPWPTLPTTCCWRQASTFSRFRFGKTSGTPRVLFEPPPAADHQWGGDPPVNAHETLTSHRAISPALRSRRLWMMARMSMRVGWIW